MRVVLWYSLKACCVLAWAACAVACGDADAMQSVVDAGKQDSGGGVDARGGVGARGGAAGKGGTGGTMVVDPPFDAGRRSCEDIAEEAAQAVSGDRSCFDCLCDMNPAATAQCTGDCWKLALCAVASCCPVGDGECIRSHCVGPLGGADVYMAAAMLTMATPFPRCVAACFAVSDHCGEDAGE